jgi:hypothetical protein
LIFNERIFDSRFRFKPDRAIAERHALPYLGHGDEDAP